MTPKKGLGGARVERLIIPGTLLEKLRCPSCQGEVSSGKENLLCCPGCSKEYPVFNGTPVFLDQEVSYDALYSQIDFRKTPFGYGQEYFAWRRGKILREIVAYLQEGSVLDDGGGYGFLREFLSPEEHEYFNVDCSREMISYDTGNLKCVARGEELPFKDKSFDNVVSADVLEHVQDKIQYLREAYRVLKDGGIFVVNTPRAGWLRSYLSSPWFWIPFLSYAWRHGRRLLGGGASAPEIRIPEGVVDLPSDEEWLKDRIESLGYRVITVTRTDNHPFNLTHKLWRDFADRFIDPKRFGHCVLIAGKKL